MNRCGATGFILAIVLLTLFTGCATPPEQGVMSGAESQLKMRSIQTRAFDTSDRQKVLRAVIATLQDLEFFIDSADASLGSVTARKFNIASGVVNDLKVTVTVRPRDGGQTLVRMNAEFNRKPVEDPEVYQRFFVALGKSLFLSAQQVE
jgi:hypothetical protein